MRILHTFKLLNFFIICATFIILAGCTAPPAAELAEESGGDTAAEEAANGSILSDLEANGQFKILIDALQQTELFEELDREESYTFLAPTDEAFKKLPPETLEQLLSNNTDILNEILRYHVLTKEFFTEELFENLANSTPANRHTPTLQLETFFAEKSATIALVNGFLKVNNAQIIEPDLEISNGIIHGIDTVLMPIAPPPPNAPEEIVDGIEVWLPYELGESLFVRDAELVPGAEQIRMGLENVSEVLRTHQDNTGFSNQINTARTVRLTDDEGTIYLAPVGPNEEFDQEILQAIAEEIGLVIALMVVEARDESTLPSGSYVVRVRFFDEWFVEFVSQEGEILKEIPSQLTVREIAMGNIPDVALFYGTIWCEASLGEIHWCWPCWWDEDSACEI